MLNAPHELTIQKNGSSIHETTIAGKSKKNSRGYMPLAKLDAWLKKFHAQSADKVENKMHGGNVHLNNYYKLMAEYGFEIIKDPSLKGRNFHHLPAQLYVTISSNNWRGKIEKDEIPYWSLGQQYARTNSPFRADMKGVFGKELIYGRTVDDLKRALEKLLPKAQQDAMAFVEYMVQIGYEVNDSLKKDIAKSYPRFDQHKQDIMFTKDGKTLVFISDKPIKWTIFKKLSFDHDAISGPYMHIKSGNNLMGLKSSVK